MSGIGPPEKASARLGFLLPFLMVLVIRAVIRVMTTDTATAAFVLLLWHYPLLLLLPRTP